MPRDPRAEEHSPPQHHPTVRSHLALRHGAVLTLSTCTRLSIEELTCTWSSSTLQAASCGITSRATARFPRAEQRSCFTKCAALTPAPAPLVSCLHHGAGVVCRRLLPPPKCGASRPQTREHHVRRRASLSLALHHRLHRLDDKLNVKLADFGLSNDMVPGQLLKTICGSPAYSAPEIVAGKRYDGCAVDVWSCGVILYCMCVGRLPFDGANQPELFSKISAGALSSTAPPPQSQPQQAFNNTSGAYTIPDSLSHDCADLIRQFLVVDPSRRITISQAWHHPWLSSVNAGVLVACTCQQYVRPNNPPRRPNMRFRGRRCECRSDHARKPRRLRWSFRRERCRP